jgi:hypothetical protein
MTTGIFPILDIKVFDLRYVVELTR